LKYLPEILRALQEFLQLKRTEQALLALELPMQLVVVREPQEAFQLV
jgi:hypothetical protein